MLGGAWQFRVLEGPPSVHVADEPREVDCESRRLDRSITFAEGTTVRVRGPASAALETSCWKRKG